MDKSVVIAGAGLAGGLLAARLLSRPNPPAITFVEPGKPFGDHTWSFHAGDVPEAEMAWLQPLVAHRWAGQSVRFPGYERRLSAPYFTMVSDSVRASLEGRVSIVRGEVAEIGPGAVTLKSGERIEGGLVVDARGFLPHPGLVLGYQKFVGLEVETQGPHGVAEPVIMDATVDQLDGYRFVYLLPFSPTRLLIEDTRYTDGAALDDEALNAGVSAYAREKGWSLTRVVRREKGVLPIALAFDPEAFWADRPQEVPVIGMRAGLFHPTTGYSVPEAVRMARIVSDNWSLGSVAVADLVRKAAKERARAGSFYRLLNRMLFKAARPQQRVRVLERFYRLESALIARFYAGETSRSDQARILIGKPPVSVVRAMGCLFEAPFLRRGKT